MRLVETGRLRDGSAFYVESGRESGQLTVSIQGGLPDNPYAVTIAEADVSMLFGMLRLINGEVPELKRRRLG